MYRYLSSINGCYRLIFKYTSTRLLFLHFKQIARKSLCINLRLKFSLKTMASSVPMKPPNVLVYSGENIFQNIAKSLYKCLHVDKYVIYHLKPNQVLTTPWMENVALLVVFSNEVTGSIAKEFIQYVEKGGKLLIIGSEFNISGVCTTQVCKNGFVRVKYENGSNAEGMLYRGKYAYSMEDGLVLATDDKNNSLVTRVKKNDGIMIVSSVYLCLNISEISSHIEKEEFYKDYSNDYNLAISKTLLTEQFGLEGYVSELPTPTPGYVIMDKNYQIENMMKLLSISEISLEKSLKLPSDKNKSSGLKVPLIFEDKGLKTALFDSECFFSTLNTSHFGKIVVFFPVVTSTMHPSEHLTDYPGLVVVANRQLAGKGRGDNLWLSPEGCAAFTLHFPLMLSSKLGQRMSLMQHMASLAVVHGIQKKPGYEDLKFCVKWPNDIYYEKDKKIGGVLVNTTIQGDVVHAFIGIGVNVSNHRPTVCINSVIQDYNASHGKTLSTLKVEEVIALTLTELENLTKDFNDSAKENFLHLYYNYWIHQNQSVMLANSNENAIVKAIDEYGFLIVETEHGKKVSLQPDGNRFDMMKNLIVSKEL